MKGKSKNKTKIETENGLIELELPRSKAQAEVVKTMMETGETSVIAAVKETFPQIDKDAAHQLSHRIRSNPAVVESMTNFVKLLDVVGLDDVAIVTKLKEHLHARKEIQKWDKASECFIVQEGPDYAIQEKALEKILKLKSKYPDEVQEESIVTRILKKGGGVETAGAEEVAYQKRITKRSSNN